MGKLSSYFRSENIEPVSTVLYASRILAFYPPRLLISPQPPIPLTSPSTCQEKKLPDSTVLHT